MTSGTTVMAKKQTPPPDALIGYQIRHRKLDKTPYGLPERAVYSFDFVTTWVANAFNRTVWQLLPVHQEDVAGDTVDMEVMPHGTKEALQLVRQFNKTFGPKEAKLTKLGEVRDFLYAEMHGKHGESERRVAAQFALDAIDDNEDEIGDTPGAYAADLLESLGSACMAMAEQLRPREAEDEDDT